MPKVLITGASGFIGNHVIEELLKNNCTVIATSSNEEKARAASWFSHVRYIPFNLKDFDNSVNYYEYFSTPDALIHLAWEGLPNYKMAFHLEKNLPLNYSFLKNCIDHGLTDLTISGTCLEYGMHEGCLTEDMDSDPVISYAMAKDRLRKRLEQLQQEKKINFKWLRLFYVYGKGQGANSLLSQLERALSNGETVFNMSGGLQQRDYLPVENAAENIVKAALQNEVTGIINCSSGSPVAVKEFVENYLEKHQQHIRLNLGYYPYADYEPMRFWGDNKKLKSIITGDDN